jgi:hypothetical protein
MEVLHVVLARGLEINQHRRFSGEPIQPLQINFDAQPAGQCREVNQCIGRAADGQRWHLLSDGHCKHDGLCD